MPRIRGRYCILHLDSVGFVRRLQRLHHLDEGILTLLSPLGHLTFFVAHLSSVRVRVRDRKCVGRREAFDDSAARPCLRVRVRDRDAEIIGQLGAFGLLLHVSCLRIRDRDVEIIGRSMLSVFCCTSRVFGLGLGIEMPR